MIVQVIIVNGVFIVLNFTLCQLYILWISALVSIYYYLNRLMHVKSLTFSNIIYKEAPHQVLYMFWLYFFQKDQYIYYIPLALSTVGKINFLFTNTHSQQNTEKTQELILFQIKCQGFLLGYLLLCLFRFNLSTLAQFITFGVLQKLKYSLYFASQKAYVELHFSIDNLTRRWGFRSLYHLLYMGITVFSSTYSAQRDITY